MKKFRLSIYEPEQRFLRKWLVKKRLEAKLSQRDLAQKLQVVHSLVGKVEKGERRLDIIEFITYCHGVDADPCELFILIQNMPPHLIQYDFINE